MRQQLFQLATLLLLTMALALSCQKQIDQPAAKEIQSLAAKQDHGHLNQTKTFNATGPMKWQDIQLRMLYQSAEINVYGVNGIRWFAYCGIGLYESVVPGMPSYKSLHGQLTDMPEMPATEPGKAYHWPTCANAALAYLNKHFYTAANSAAYQYSLDSLENALNAEYEAETDGATFQRSKDFGKAVAEKIYAWSEVDGYKVANRPFTWPVYPIPEGTWTNTAPNPTGIAAPYWGENRPFVPGSTTGTASPLPPTYSADPNSGYYAMVKEVYDISQQLTDAQKEAANYFNDEPGYKAGTHYISVFDQVMHNENRQLDFYALAHAKTAISMAESMINCWKIKYAQLVDRPIRYIRNVLGYSTWEPFIHTHPHPEFPSGHSQNAGAFAAAMTSIFGDNYHLTLHTYDNKGLSPRSYNSFNEMAIDIGKARVYGGIHNTYSCVEGRKQGERIANNVISMLKFQKD